MKAFLLAAGLGTRLRPLTETVPKCLVPIQGEPLLGVWLRHCRHQGFTEVGINLHAQADQVRTYVESRRWGLEVRLFEEPELLGSAGTLAANRAWVADDDCFGIFYADVLSNADLAALVRIQRRVRPAATLGLYRVERPRECGIVSLDAAGIIQNFVEKPAEPRGDLAFSGVMIAGRGLFEAIPARVPADLGGQVLPRLVGRMRGLVLDGFVLDIGSWDKYRLAQASWPGLALSMGAGGAASPGPRVSKPARAA